jgi:hypothetical protein
MIANSTVLLSDSIIGKIKSLFSDKRRDCNDEMINFAR